MRCVAAWGLGVGDAVDWLIECGAARSNQVKPDSFNCGTRHADKRGGGGCKKATGEKMMPVGYWEISS